MSEYNFRDEEVELSLDNIYPGGSSTPTSSASFDTNNLITTIREFYHHEPDFFDFAEKFERKEKKIEDKEIISDLSEAYKKGDLTFVLGSGVSKSQGSLLWDELLTELMKKSINEILDISGKKANVLSILFLSQFSKNSLIKAKCIKQYVGSKHYPFERHVKNLLYKNVDWTIKPLLREILNFCRNSNSVKRLDSIVTYNYDDLIEYFCDDKSIDYKCVYSNKTLTKGKGIPIYHVHGFLPNKSSLKNVNIDDQVMLSEEKYHKQYSNIYHWANLVQLDKFINKNCLFIGLSFEDPNMRRLLDYAYAQCAGEQKHYVISERKDDEIIRKLKDKLKPDDELLSMKREVGLSFDDAARSVINLIHKLEEKDRKLFGIDTYRVKDVNKIPKILKKIREKK